MILMEIRWVANPFRGEKFGEGWVSSAEAVLDYGATQWSFCRAHDGRLDFVQTALFPSKAHFERYWYSEQIAEKRVELAGYYQIPILPTYWEVLGAGEAISPLPVAPSSARRP
jgi:hypothetical protein